LLGVHREAARKAGAPDRESYLVIVESLLPDPQGALNRLIEQARAEGAQLAAHWSLAARDRGSNTTEVTFVPTDQAKQAPKLLASGTWGSARIEIELGLAHANEFEDVSFKRTLVRGKKFTMLVLSHEEDGA